MSDNKALATDLDHSLFSGVVVYTDGSCRPTNPGYIGWGAHGYFWNDDEVTKTSHVAETCTLTDHGYVLPTQEMSPKLKRVTPVAYLDAFGSSLDIATNNAAEAQAVAYTLEALQGFPLKRIQIVSDSKYVIDNVNNSCKYWSKNGWRDRFGEPIKNVALFQRIWELVLLFKEKGVKLKLDWTRGHVGEPGNERADFLANIGAAYSREAIFKRDFTLSAPKKYWDASPEKNPYLGFKYLYFNSCSDNNHPKLYYQAESSVPEFVLGKPASTVGYSVVLLKDEEPMVTMLQKRQNYLSRGEVRVMALRMDDLYKASNWNWLDRYQGYALNRRRRSNTLELFNGAAISQEIDPTGLSYRAIEHFSFLQTLLGDYVNLPEGSETFTSGGNEHYVQDITDQFYETVKGKKNKEIFQLKPEFIVGFKDMKLHLVNKQGDDVIEMDIPYALGLDIPNRNALKRIESCSPTIHLLTWRETAHTLRYATVIESTLGIGVWSNYFSDRIFIKIVTAKGK